MHCPHCGSSSVFYDGSRGEFVCTSCGLIVFDKVLEAGPERHIRPGEGTEHADQSAGVDFSVHDLGVGTDFRVPREASPSKRAAFRRMRFLHKTSRATKWKERSLREQLLYVDKICEELSISKGVKLEICALYRKAKSAGILKGRDARAVAVALVFLVCRARGFPRSEREIAQIISREHKIDLFRATKNLRRVSKILREKLGIEPRKVSARHYLLRFVSDFRFNQKEIATASELLSRLSNFAKSKSPRLVAAVIIYLAATEHAKPITMREVANVVGVSLSALSLNVKACREFLVEEQ